MSRSGREQEEPEAIPDASSTAVAVPPACSSTHRALAECHSRASDPRQREVQCRHLNRALAECVVSACCPGETEAVRSLCGSAGTALKRSQCQRARVDLSLCLRAHQEP